LLLTRREIHLLLRQATYDVGRFQFNTVASAAMKLLNALERAAQLGDRERTAFDDALAREGMSVLLRVLAPITPHISQQLWRELEFGDDIIVAPWPEPLEEALQQDEIELVLQINGKHRGNLRVPAQATKEAIEQLAIGSPVAVKYLAGAVARKVVVVPGRLVNIVL
jgi:leucyl-tRNA synthetase